VPDFRTNLLSVSKICDHGFNIVFKKEKAEIIRATGGEIVFTAPRKLDLYQIEKNTNAARSLQVSKTASKNGMNVSAILMSRT